MASSYVLIAISSISSSSSSRIGFLLSQMESRVLALYHGQSSRLLSENCISNSRRTASNCNCQYVSQFCSSDHDVASECENPKRGKKLKYPRNLSLKEIKSCYRDKLPVGLLALGYITLSNGVFRLRFHNYFDFVSSFS